MSLAYIRYELQDGFVHHWLAAGPLAIPVRNLERFAGEDFKRRIVRHYYEERSGITQLPVERGPLEAGTFKIGHYEGAWSYVHCRDDHFVNHAGYYPTCHYLRSWAYAEIVSRKPQEVLLQLTTYGPADVWLNGNHVLRQEHFCDQPPLSIPVQVGFQRGANRLLVRFETVAVRACSHLMALQICRSAVGQPSPDGVAPAADMRVRLPTTIETVPRRNRFEQVFEAAYLDRDIFEPDDQIVVQWPDDRDMSAITSVRLQSPSGRIHAESYEKGSPGDRAFLGRASEVPPGPYRAVVMPSPREYYEGNRRIKRELSLWCLGNTAYAETSYGTYPQRREEALISAATREGGLFSEIAKMALGRWTAVNPNVIWQSMEGIDQRRDGSDVELLGLLGVWYRFSGHPQFPEALRQPLQNCILTFKYWRDEPGSDVMCYTTENHRIVFHACEILAGQLYPDRIFPNSGQSGQWHRQKGERLALAWLHERGAAGFEDWDSPGSFADDLMALSHLIDLAESEQVWEMASVVMDKMLFTIALNSYKGVFGSTHGRTTSLQIKGGLLEATSGITRLMWGLGIFNQHLAGTVSLACMEKYELPPILSEIATSRPAELWSRERHVAASSDEGRAKREVNKVTYKTPDYLLCSAQDYAAGTRGSQEHLWQATLGRAAVVFVTHPACAQDNGVIAPNFWLGNAVLPRLAQWKDVLIAIHHLPPEDWMGFTHAYFPIYAFDEYGLRGGWAFARKGNGYLALIAAQGLNLVRQGHSAYRELRSYGRHNVWLCHMGRSALDGDFGTFQDKVLALEVAFDDLTVRWTTLRGDKLSFGWEGPLLRNGHEEPLAGFRHYENTYTIVDLPCTQMEVRLDEYLLRLDFGRPQQPKDQIF